MESFSSLISPAHQFSIEEAMQGECLTPKDRKRLAGAYEKVFAVMKDGKQRTPDQISSESGVRLDSALRHVRTMKKRVAFWEKKNVGKGLYLYRIIPSFEE